MGNKPQEPPPRKRMSWLRREGIDLGDAVVQFIAVVVGIVLGLFISQWATNRQQQAAAHKAMHAVRIELTANRAALHQNALYWHKHVAQTMAMSKNVKSPTTPRSYCAWPGYNSNHATVAFVTDAAYKTAITTGAIANMPFAHAHRLARVYGYQQHAIQMMTFLLHHVLYSAHGGSLGRCLGAMESFTRNDRLLDMAYTRIIGPDKTPWPSVPHISRGHFGASQ